MTPPKPPNQIGAPKDRKKPVRVVGIDLGTTNSTIAEVRWEPGGAAQTGSRACLRFITRGGASQTASTAAGGLCC